MSNASFLTMTSGSGTLNHSFDHYGPVKEAPIAHRNNGVLVGQVVDTMSERMFGRRVAELSGRDASSSDRTAACNCATGPIARASGWRREMTPQQVLQDTQ